MTDILKAPVADRLPVGERGVAKIQRIEVTERMVMFASLQDPWGYTPPGEYTRLLVEGGLMMSDTRMERSTSMSFVRHAHGRVLIGGLGLGMVLPDVLTKPEVTEVTVIEKFQDVIDLVEPHYRDPKLTVICADMLEWKPQKGEKFDTLFFDIWPGRCTDNLDDMAKLHRRFSHYKAQGAWMDSWFRDELIYKRRQEQRQYRY